MQTLHGSAFAAEGWPQRIPHIEPDHQSQLSRKLLRRDPGTGREIQTECGLERLLLWTSLAESLDDPLNEKNPSAKLTGSGINQDRPSPRRC